jgi:ABC-type lipoprotein release transport system permease subunit
MILNQSIESITFKIFKTTPTNEINNPFIEEVISTITIQDLTIVGVIGRSIEASAGLFDVVNELSVMYVPDTLFSENGTEFLQTLQENEMKYALVKIKESEFNVADPGAVNGEINALINIYEREFDFVIGSNEVETKLLPFQILSYFIFIFDAILTIPVVILSLYLLSFGIDLSLAERGYFVGVLKTQGASPSQIKRKILGETLLLAVLGLIIGYILALFGGWAIGTAKGFLSWDVDYALSKISDFLIFDQTAFLFVGGFVVLILIYMVNSKSNSFIRLEISETVRESVEEHKGGVLRRNNLDILFFVIGLMALILVLLPSYGVSFNLGIIQVLIEILGPILFWIGGGAMVSRLAVWLPPKTDPLIKRLGFSKDIAIFIKANIFRKSGDIPRLALIISLTVSFAVLANVQGQTGEINDERVTVWNTGADMIVKTSNLPTLITTGQIKQIGFNNEIQDAMGVGSYFGTALNDDISIFSVDSANYEDVGIWQSDDFPNNDRTERLNDLSSNAKTGSLIGVALQDQTSVDVGEKLTIEILTSYWNGTMCDTLPCLEIGPRSIETNVLGVFDHLPGGIGGNSLLVDHQLINSLYNLTGFIGLTPIPLEGVVSGKYMVNLKEGLSLSEMESIKDDVANEDFVQRVTLLQEELEAISRIENVDFGIPGLLTADFIVSLMAATLGVYIFMSILLEKRKKEFAILRSYGASKTQIYKIIFSETFVLLLTAVLWGLLIGLGLGILFNGFFEFINFFVTPVGQLVGYQIKRVIVFDVFTNLFTLSLVFVSMLIATFISLRGALKANISTQLRQL